IAGSERPIIVAVNKIDLIGDSRLENALKLIKRLAPQHEITIISAKKGVNIDYLLRRIVDKISNLKV
ncbi:MAG: hypothetical protein DRJ60_07180, partial [Thermoprotei archaeon]